MSASDALLPSRRVVRSPRARKAAVAIAQSIVDEITDRGYAPGTKLPREKDMLAHYDVGRSTLRESLRFLELNGIIVLKAGPSGGPMVATPDAHNLAGVLGLFLQLQPTPFSAIVEARLVLEPVIARLAAANISEEQLSTLGHSIESMQRFVEDEEAFLVENERFHETTATASGNPLFSLLISSMHQITDGMPIGVSYPQRRREAVIRAHSSIYEALRNRDCDAAHATMSRHMTEFQRYVEKNYPSVNDKRLRWSDIAP